MFKYLLTLPFLFVVGCTGSILEEPLLPELASSKGSNGIEYDEYIPPGIQFVESTTQGMNQEGFPYLRKNRTFNIKWIIKTCTSEADISDGVCANLSAEDKIKNPDPGFYISKIDYSPDNGATWNAISGAENIGGYNDQVQSFNWSIPDSFAFEGENFKFRLRTKNGQGTEFTVTSSSFIMDNSAPVIVPESLKFNNSLESPLILKSPGVSIDFSANDTLSPIAYFCIKNEATPPANDDPCWIKLTNMGLSESKNAEITKLKRTLGWFGGSFAYYFWVRDRAGNPSVLTNEVGDTSIDFRTIAYSPGKAIAFSKALAGNTDNFSANPEVVQTLVNAENPTIYIKWNYFKESSASVDEVEPYQIQYSTNGIDFSPLTVNGTVLSGSELASLVDQGCTPISTSESLTHTKCLKWNPPESLHNNLFYLRVNIKDSAGFVYTTGTNPLNMNVSPIAGNQAMGLRYIAGVADSLIGGSALNAKFNVPQTNEGGKLAVHPDGRIFILDGTYGVVVISPIDGKTSIYVKLGTSVDGIAVDNQSLLGTGEVEGKSKDLQRISLDYQGRLLLFENTKIRMVTDEYDSERNLTGRRVIKTIIGCTTSPCFYDNDEKNKNYSAQTPKKYWQNAWIYANEFNFKGSVRYESTLLRHFTPTPNGDIYFTLNTNWTYLSTVKPSSANSYQGLDIRVYRPDPDPNKPGKIYPLRLNGFGVQGEAFRPVGELYPSSAGGLVFNPSTGLPTTFHMIWQNCPPNPSNYCNFYTSNHNPKTGASNGTGTHYLSIPMSINSSYTTNPMRWSLGYQDRLITSRRGELYIMDRGNFTAPALYKLNSSTNKFVRILGNSFWGYCVDGTLATNCANRIVDAWITEDDTVFFIDHHQVRMIGKDGKVSTLFGRKTADGTDKDAMLSTLGNIDTFAVWKKDQEPYKFIIKENENYLLREFPLGGSLSKIAGDETSNWNLSLSRASSINPGYYVSTKTAAEIGFWPGANYINPPVIANPKNGEVYVANYGETNLTKLIRQENTNESDRGRWMNLLGGGGSNTPLFGTKGVGSCDGKMNTQCRAAWSGSVKILGYIPEKTLTPDENGNPRTRPGQMVTLINRYNSAIAKWEKYFLKLVNSETGLMTHFAGDGNTIYDSYTQFFPDTYSGVEMANSILMPFAYQAIKYPYDSYRDAILVATFDGNRIGFIEMKSDVNEQIVSAGKYYNLTTTSSPIRAFSHARVNGKDVIYYCNNGGKLQRKIVTNSSSSEINIPLPSGVICHTVARSMEAFYNEELDTIKVYFSIRVNGQTTLGEYVDKL